MEDAGQLRVIQCINKGAHGQCAGIIQCKGKGTHLGHAVMLASSWKRKRWPGDDKGQRTASFPTEKSVKCLEIFVVARSCNREVLGKTKE